MTYNTIDDVMDAYVESAKGYLSYSHSKEEDDAECKYIIENYNGSADEYAFDDLSVTEYFSSRLDYAFEETFRSISPFDYHKIIQSVEELNNFEIDEIIDDLRDTIFVATEVKDKNGYVEYESTETTEYGEAIARIMNVLAPEYDSKLSEYFVDVLQTRVDEYLRHN